jgi:hypothetical protein
VAYCRVRKGTSDQHPKSAQPSPQSHMISLIELRGRAVNISISYSRGLGFKCRSGGGYPEVLRGFSQSPPGKCRDSTLKLGHDRFLPNFFHPSFAYHPFIRRYTAEVPKLLDSPTVGHFGPLGGTSCLCQDHIYFERNMDGR